MQAAGLLRAGLSHVTTCGHHWMTESWKCLDRSTSRCDSQTDLSQTDLLFKTRKTSEGAVTVWVIGLIWSVDIYLWFGTVLLFHFGRLYCTSSSFRVDSTTCFPDESRDWLFNFI